ncbi:MAG: tetratricopeptide repeat protein [Deltaproteobacteria bacterium]|nr:tetratricopeptide repeat protein [Deltaproteobacteria bacterium]
MRRTPPSVIVAAGLAAAVLLPFAQLAWARFIAFDDPSYVTANPYVRQGLTARGVRWAFTSTELANWHPLTWLSHMLDVQVFGMYAGGHHLTSVVLHVANALLLFVALRAMGAADGRSALVAVLFGIHPLHVESVAWVSERKDVLSTTFLFLALIAYAAYVKRPSAVRYTRVAGAFVLGLMCKSMLVTFPFVLLLLDVWPLRRLALGGTARSATQASGDRALGLARVRPARVLLEKLPLVVLSVGVSVVTLVAQRGAMSVIDAPLSRRAANAALAYVTYLRKMLWPVDLSCFYPYPKSVSWWAVGAAVLVLAGSSVVAIVQRQARPYLFVGWFWFVGMLVPVIGLVQVGAQALADRYTYVPLVGVFLALVWGASDVCARWRVGRSYRYAGACVVVVACLASTWFQVSRWQDGITLFRHALAVTRDNHLAAFQVGAQLDTDGDLAEASRYYAEALRMKPDYADPHNNLGLILAKQGNAAAALAHYDVALALAPLYADAHYNRGLLLQKSGRPDEAVEEYHRALAIRPSDVEAHSNLGVILYVRGALEEAEAHLREAVRLEPDHVAARINLGVVLCARGDLDGAIVQYAEALRRGPGSPDAHYDLGNVLLQRGDREGAVRHYREALRVKPDYTAAEEMLRQAVDPQPR